MRIGGHSSNCHSDAAGQISVVPLRRGTNRQGKHNFVICTAIAVFNGGICCDAINGHLNIQILHVFTSTDSIDKGMAYLLIYNTTTFMLFAVLRGINLFVDQCAACVIGRCLFAIFLATLNAYGLSITVSRAAVTAIVHIGCTTGIAVVVVILAIGVAGGRNSFGVGISTGRASKGLYTRFGASRSSGHFTGVAVAKFLFYCCTAHSTGLCCCTGCSVAGSVRRCTHCFAHVTLRITVVVPNVLTIAAFDALCANPFAIFVYIGISATVFCIQICAITIKQERRDHINRHHTAFGVVGDIYILICNTILYRIHYYFSVTGTVNLCLARGNIYFSQRGIHGTINAYLCVIGRRIYTIILFAGCVFYRDNILCATHCTTIISPLFAVIDIHIDILCNCTKSTFFNNDFRARKQCYILRHGDRRTRSNINRNVVVDWQFKKNRININTAN